MVSMEPPAYKDDGWFDAKDWGLNVRLIGDGRRRRLRSALSIFNWGSHLERVFV